MIVVTLQQQVKINSDARFTEIRKSNDQEIEFQIFYNFALILKKQ